MKKNGYAAADEDLGSSGRLNVRNTFLSALRNSMIPSAQHQTALKLSAR